MQTALIDPLRNMKVTNRLRYGDECLIGVELFDGSRTQADNIAELSRADQARLAGRNPVSRPIDRLLPCTKSGTTCLTLA